MCVSWYCLLAHDFVLQLPVQDVVYDEPNNSQEEYKPSQLLPEFISTKILSVIDSQLGCLDTELPFGEHQTPLHHL